MARKQAVKVRILKLDPGRINDGKLLDEWDRIWAKVSLVRIGLSRARQAGQPITVEAMQEYEQARNEERQFFWDHFYEQD